MNTNPQFSLEDLRLSLTSRVSRLAIGALLLAIPMTQNGVLGELAVLPLLAIYPLLTAILGFGLVEVLLVNRRRDKPQTWLVKAARACLVILGSSLIAFVMVSEVAPVWLALLAIFPILMAVVGSDFVGEALAVRRTLQTVEKDIPLTVHTRLLHMPMRGKAHEAHNPQKAA